MASRVGLGLVQLLPVAFLACFVAWPLVAIALSSFTERGLVAPLVETLGRSSTWSVLGFTVYESALSSGLTLVFGLPVAGVLALYRFPGRLLLRSATVVPFVLPTLVVASAISAVLDRLGIEHPLVAVLAAHVFFNLALVVRIVGGRLDQLGGSLGEAASVLGASPWKVWRTVTLPLLWPSIGSVALLTFLFSFTSFGIIRSLGGLRMATLETEIYRQAVAHQNFDVAAVLAMVQLGVIALALAAHSSLAARTSAGLASGSGVLTVGPRPVQHGVSSPGSGAWRRRLAILSAVAIVVAVQGLPILSLIEGSLRVGAGGPRSTGFSYGLDNYAHLGDRPAILPVTPLAALANSARFALVAALCASLVGVGTLVAVARHRRVGRVVLAAAVIPLGASAVTLGFGYVVAFSVLDIRRSWWVVPAAHAAVGLPFLLATSIPALTAIGRSMAEAAGTLGARPLRVAQSIYWPLLRPALVTGASFAAAVSLGEFGATSFLARGTETYTAPLAIFRLLGTPGPELRGQAMALSVVLGLAVGSLALLADRGLTGRIPRRR